MTSNELYGVISIHTRIFWFVLKIHEYWVIIAMYRTKIQKSNKSHEGTILVWALIAEFVFTLYRYICQTIALKCLYRNCTLDYGNSVTMEQWHKHTSQKWIDKRFCCTVSAIFDIFLCRLALFYVLHSVYIYLEKFMRISFIYLIETEQQQSIWRSKEEK